MINFDSKFLRAAKALGAKDWSHPKIIRLARHMAHDGSSLSEITEAVGWNVCVQTARVRLKNLNIRVLPRKGARKIRLDGAEPYLAKRDCYGLGLPPYRPKRMRASG